jgi:hypothetical protein
VIRATHRSDVLTLAIGLLIGAGLGAIPVPIVGVDAERAGPVTFGSAGNRISGSTGLAITTVALFRRGVLLCVIFLKNVCVLRACPRDDGRIRTRRDFRHQPFKAVPHRAVALARGSRDFRTVDDDEARTVHRDGAAQSELLEGSRD